MLLEHVGYRPQAERIERAVVTTLEKRIGLTRDLGGDGTTATITEEIVRNLGA
jgi:isocitrate dehydrogenase (NAD+)